MYSLLIQQLISDNREYAKFHSLDSQNLTGYQSLLDDLENRVTIDIILEHTTPELRKWLKNNMEKYETQNSRNANHL